MPDLPYFGETAALAAAGVWACSTMLWRRLGERVRPMVLNLVKGLIALVMLAPLVVLADKAGFDPVTCALFAVSGVIGIGVGDTFYFRALNAIGPTRALLLQMVAPPLAVIGGWATLGQRLTAAQGLGIAVTLSGVAWVITHRPAAERARPREAGFTAGVAAGAAAGALSAAAILVNEFAFAGREDLSVPVTTALRLGAGTLALGLILPLVKPPAGAVRLADQPRGIWPVFVVATFLGTFMGLLLMQAAVGSSAETGVVQTLLATSPLFVLPLTALAGERVTWQQVAGALVATAGVGLLFAGADTARA